MNGESENRNCVSKSRRADSTVKTWWVFLFVFTYAFLLFGKTLWHDWTYDDFPVILFNPDILSFDNFLDNVRPGRPLRELSYLIDYKIFGLDPGLFQIQNIAWHALNSGSLWLLLRQCKVPALAALGGAMVFLVHPLTVEVVANASHRKDSLAVAFSLLSLLCYRKFLARTSIRRLWLAMAVGMFLLACASKQNALMVPLVWAAAELSSCSAEKRFLTRYPFVWLVGLFGCLVSFLIWFISFEGWVRMMAGIKTLLIKINYFDEPNIADYLAMLLKCFAQSAAKVVWPFRLAPEYTESIPVSFAEPWVLAGAIVLIIFGVAVVRLRSRVPQAWLALVWTGVFWLPVSNLWPLTYFQADRYLYAPLLGLVMFVTIVLAQFKWRRIWLKKFAVVSSLVLVILLSTLTCRQVDVWADEFSLWSHVNQINPQSASALINLSGHYISIERDFETGRDYALKAVEVNPLHPAAYKNLAVAYERLGNHSEAIKHYRTAYDLFLNKQHPFSKSIRNHLYRNYRIVLP